MPASASAGSTRKKNKFSPYRCVKLPGPICPGNFSCVKMLKKSLDREEFFPHLGVYFYAKIVYNINYILDEYRPAPVGRSNRMTRSNAREIAVHFIFELSFSKESAQSLLEKFLTPEAFVRLGEEEPLYAQFPNAKQKSYIENLVAGVYQHSGELDGYIEQYAQGWRFSRIDRVAVAIMRCSMYEILYLDDVPTSASINEAVEIAKGYESPETCAFINGILGTFVRERAGDSAQGEATEE